MRVSTIFVTACLALFASAESTSAQPASTTDAAASAAASAQAAIAKCLDACKPGDVNCAAVCVTVPNPSAAQVSHPAFLSRTPGTLHHPFPHYQHHHASPVLITLHNTPPTIPNNTNPQTNPHPPSTGQRHKQLRSRLPARLRHRGRDTGLLDVRAGVHRRQLLQPAVGHAAAHGRRGLGQLGQLRQLGKRRLRWELCFWQRW